MAVRGETAASPSNAAESDSTGKGGGQAVPDTLFMSRVKWSWGLLVGAGANACIQSLTFDQHDTSAVKGDGDDFAEDLAETEKEACARVEEAAHINGLQEDLLFVNDVMKQQVAQAAETFMTDSVQG